MRDAQRSLEQGLRGVSAAFEQLAADLGDARTDAEQAQVFVAFATDQGIGRAFDELGEAQNAYSRAGYRVFDAVPAAPATSDTAPGGAGKP